MRIHVYDEEMTGDVELIEKRDIIGADGQPTTFYGVRFWLLGSDRLHQTEHDDDRPAVTLWVGSPPAALRLAETLNRARDLAIDAERNLEADQ
jgi:hypothetical protein